MTKCSCGATFDDRDEAESHVVNEHADVCDNWLAEYVTDSQRDAIEEMLADDD